MEPDQKLLDQHDDDDDQEKLPLTIEQNDEIKDTEKKNVVEAPLAEVDKTETDKSTEASKECVEPAVSSDEKIPVKEEMKVAVVGGVVNENNDKKAADSSSEKVESQKIVEKVQETETVSVDVVVNEPKPEPQPETKPEPKPEPIKDEPSDLPSFPGTITKVVPGSNDVKIEIDSNSLLDRVILYSLKNTVVDNSRLDAAKNKYNLLYNGNKSSSFNVVNGSGSDSSMSSKSEEKSNLQLKGETSEVKNEVAQADNKQGCDIRIESSNGAEANAYPSNNKSLLDKVVDADDDGDSSTRRKSRVEEVSRPKAEKSPVELVSSIKATENDQTIANVKLTLNVSHKSSSENEALDFRDQKDDNGRNEDLIGNSPVETLDLTVPHRDEKSMPPIKRNLALYVGLPDFSKKIFTEPSVNKAMKSEPDMKGSCTPKVRNPDFSAMPRTAAPELQIRHLDFSKGFTAPEAPKVTPSNFPEIVRKNNYISDLQLKPSLQPSSNHASSTSSSSSYKIEYPSSAAISQQLQHSRPENHPDNSSFLKKESFPAENHHNHHQTIDEPKAHIIHKNQFVPYKTDIPPQNRSWNDRKEYRDFKPHPHDVEYVEGALHPQQPSSSRLQNVNCDIQRNYSPYINNNPQQQQQQQAPKGRDIKTDTKEDQMSHEFSLKQKEQQLRQEGTIITIKNEAHSGRRSSDLFQYYKLKQPKESPGGVEPPQPPPRPVVDNQASSYHHQYPNYPPEAMKQKMRVETIVKPSSEPQQSTERQQLATSSSSYHVPSPTTFNNAMRNPQMFPKEHHSNPPESWNLTNNRDAQHPVAKPPSMVFGPKTNAYYPGTAPNPYPGYAHPHHYQNTNSTPPMAVNVNQPYQPYKPSQSMHEVKEITNRNYQQPTSSQSNSNYYHQKFPDFSHRFDLEKRQMARDPNMRHPNQPASSTDYRGYGPPPPQEVHCKVVIPQSRPDGVQYLPNGYDAEAASRHAYQMRMQEQSMRQEQPGRSSDVYESSRRPQPTSFDRKPLEETQYIKVTPSESFRRSEIIEPPKVKVEPMPVPINESSNAPKPSVIKASSSVLGEVKRESPLDLSVKTVKTKADSTGGDPDCTSRHYPEPAPLKVEFTPNFSRIASTFEGHEHPRSRSLDHEAERRRHNSNERFHYPQSVPQSTSRPQPPQVNHQQYQQVSSNRNYVKEPQSQIPKQPERPPAPQQVRNHYPERPRYHSESLPQPPHPHGYPVHYPKEMPRHDEKLHAQGQRMPSHEVSSAAFVERPPPPPHNSIAYPSDHHRQPHPGNAPPPTSSRDPLYYERERDRKRVEEMLFGQRKDPLPPDMNKPHLNAITPPPRKRIVEHQHIYSPVVPKQRKIEEMPVMAHAMPQNNYATQQKVAPQAGQYQSIERHDYNKRNMQVIGQPPALLKHKNYHESMQQQQPRDPHNYSEAANKIVGSSGGYSPYTSPYPNPKAEMIHRSDTSSHHFVNKTQIPNQNFQKRPDDNAIQLYPRIHHPIQDGGIKIEHQPTGLLTGTPGEAFRLTNGVTTTMSTTTTSSSGIAAARGADHSTIAKLKSNLEQKQEKKLTLSNSIERIDDSDNNSQSKKDLSPRQFRTKGELKGFIPLPVTASGANDASNAPAPATGSAFDLLDWGSACNDFVQQLETGKKLTTTKKKRPTKDDQKLDEKIPTAEIPGITSSISIFDIPKEVMKTIVGHEKKSSSDEDKPLLELVNSQSNSVSADTKSCNSLALKLTDKNARNHREKQRQQLEKKHAARLGDPSSSENENECKRPLRTAFKIRRLRKRAALGIKKTDEELSVEEEESEEEEVVRKRRSTRSLSKMNEMTSSDDDKKKNASNKDEKCDDEKNSSQKSSSSKKAKKSPAVATTKKQESSPESSSSDENRTSSKASPKSNKKLKKLGSASSIKNLLKEEEKTMTRSKRKMENEKKLSNSKILRNEKVVQNTLPDKKTKSEPSPKKPTLKRKNSTKQDDAKRKSNKSDSDSNVLKSDAKNRRVSKPDSSSSSEESEPEPTIINERLRTRKTRRDTELNTTNDASKSDSKAQKENKSSKATENKASLAAFKDDKPQQTTKFTPGWEAEAYSFKRSLKIPADPQTSDTSEIFSEFVKSKDKDGTRIAELNNKKVDTTKAAAPSPTKKTPTKPSIIDMLHQRAIQSRKKFKTRKAACTSSETTHAADDDLLPTPEKESEKVFGFKKNIFETSILTSRTRTENNAIRKKEILKEVFGADDDRPKSAPPASANDGDEDEKKPDEVESKISYDQKYREYLEKMNIDFLTKTADVSKTDESSKATDESKATDVSVKDEEEDEDDNVTLLSEKDLITPLGIKIKGKRGRSRRCKGSSGFDYIRKKKKPTSHTFENPLSVNNIIKKRLAAMENLESKDESDISKEIKGWVLNKGVGESVLHKASRLDYVDVIAYCLDRMNMSPDPKDNAGYTPLHEACSRGHLEIVRILLQYGANHSETALSGIRPLHEAIENGHVEIVRLLISFGADPCLATYSGQLPVAMAEDEDMISFLHEYLVDIDDKKAEPKSWHFEGPHVAEDPTEDGFEVFNHMPLYKTELSSSIASVLSTSLTSLVTATTLMSDNDTVISENTATTKVSTTPIKPPSQDVMKYQHKMKKCDTNSNNIMLKNANSQDTNNKIEPITGKKIKGAPINQIDTNLRKIKKLPALSKTENVPPKPLEAIQKLDDSRHKDDYDDMMIDVESDNDILEVEESESPLPPLYLLKDEAVSEKWILLQDLCNLLKVKSKDAVLKQICPSSPPALNKELIRELKMSDFLDKAVCLQLFCAGEKLNVRASKVSLVRYNDSVRNLLGVQTIRMNL